MTIFEQLFRRFSKSPIHSFEEVCAEEMAFYVRFLRSGMTVVDVGACCGELSLLFARCVGAEGRVWALEPCSASYSSLETVVRLTGRSNIIPLNIAASDREGTASLHGRKDRPTLHSLISRPVHEQGCMCSEAVSILTLDSLCRDRKVGAIDLLKVDVEGSELEVLRGARELFLNQKIGCCAFEFGGTTLDAKVSIDDFRVFFSGCGYKLRNLLAEVPLPACGDYRFAMLVAEPHGRKR